MRRARQAAFEFRSWGGPREGAGRKASRARPAVPHRERENFRPHQPVHVSLRMAAWVWNLRSRRSYAIVHAAVRELRERRDLRVVDYSVQGNHLHLLGEAEGPPALAAGMRALSIRLARRLNAMMGRRGPVLEDRYHAHVLRTPAEARNALRYVLGNFRSHAERRGERMPARWVDPYTSAALPEGLHAQGELWQEPVTRPAETWLLRTAGEGGAGETRGERPRAERQRSSRRGGGKFGRPCPEASWHLYPSRAGNLAGPRERLGSVDGEADAPARLSVRRLLRIAMGGDWVLGRGIQAHARAPRP